MQSSIHEIKNRDIRLREIAKYYAGLSAAERAQTAIITATNRDRITINNNVREILKERGELSNGHVFEVIDGKGNVQDKEFAVGDKVIFLRKKEISGHLVMKNDIGIVRKIDKRTIVGVRGSGFFSEDHLSLKIETRGKNIVVNSDEYNYLDYCYC